VRPRWHTTLPWLLQARRDGRVRPFRACPGMQTVTTVTREVSWDKAHLSLRLPHVCVCVFCGCPNQHAIIDPIKQTTDDAVLDPPSPEMNSGPGPMLTTNQEDATTPPWHRHQYRAINRISGLSL